jgi:hypothetical protein
MGDEENDCQTAHDDQHPLYKGFVLLVQAKVEGSKLQTGEQRVDDRHQYRHFNNDR